MVERGGCVDEDPGAEGIGASVLDLAVVDEGFGEVLGFGGVGLEKGLYSPGVIGGVVGLGVFDMPMESVVEAGCELVILGMRFEMVRDGVKGGEFGFGPDFDGGAECLGDE